MCWFPGHGKDVVDGMNAKDKVFLKKQMLTVNTPDATVFDKNAKVKMDSAIVDGDTKAIGFAKKCVNICSWESRKMGAASHMKSKKGRKIKKTHKRDVITIKILIKLNTNTESMATVVLSPELIM